MASENGGRANAGLLDSKWVQYLVLGALLSGSAGGISTLSQDTSDRYYGSQAKADWREQRVRDHEQDLQNKAVNDRLNRHLEHSAEYTQVIKDLRERVKDLTQKLESHNH